MIELEDRWVWDSWHAEKAGQRHIFYLAAPRSLEDPDRRHAHARAGHAVSSDLRTWTEQPDALTPGAAGCFDDLAIWTGSIVERGGRWHLFYTGVSRAEGTPVQRIGHAVSDDLVTWSRVDPNPCVTADPRWYSTAPSSDEPWRDPWVFAGSDGQWHMLVTARDRATGQGTIAHAVSPDLHHWEVREPLSGASGFRQLEVTQVVHDSGRWGLVFCSSAADVLDPRVTARYATYSAPADGPLGPFHLEKAEPIGDGGLYAGRVVRDADGSLALIGFIDDGTTGGFRGAISDPVALAWTPRGTLQPGP